ncbi:aldose 1-epimerase family protein [Sphingomonas sp. Y38-1Y]|uniref:aldose 1-epimerase family protein n=1 Tax=Sphingomonas sp. Y38-1Y TaxID=3078265 RepID=UPI0028E8EC8A|nr:aldose 1-epimerase family protein [Sphingomonas sp. Y38-1Y]
MITIASADLTAQINPLGAELSHLLDDGGRELMTDANPEFWKGRAPILFPNVGALVDDHWTIDGTRYPMPKHGFARHSLFEVVEQWPDAVTFRLTDSAETRAHYPFAFALDVRHSIRGATLITEVSVENRDDRDLPASIGFHPAFAWPLPYGRDRAEHRILFEAAEPSNLARIVEGGLIGPEDRPSPLDGRTLSLADELFAIDALVWKRIVSQSVQYGAVDGPQLIIDFPDTPMLGVWTKPGAAFVCVEPWHGIADPQGFAGDIWAKPGIRRVSPGARWTVRMQVTLSR